MSAAALWLRDRRVPVAIVAVALLALLGQALLWWIGGPPNNNDFVGPPRSGYVLSNAFVLKYSPEGTDAFRLWAPHVERREGDESLYINSPKFSMPAKKPGVPDWHGESLYGWVDKTGDLLKLQGPVYVERPAFKDPQTHQPVDETTLHSSELTVWPKENRMETAQPAQIVQGARRMSGVGMRAHLNDNHLELFDASHIVFPPRAPKPPDAGSAARPARSVRPAQRVRQAVRPPAADGRQRQVD